MERSLFKQRIVGGLVLVALGAIVIPFLLDMHQEDQWWGKGNIPKKPDNGFVTRVLPLEEWSKQSRSDLAQGAKQINASPALPSAGQPASSAPAVAAPAPAAGAPLSDTPSVTTLAAEGWVVQLGSFSSEKNAEQLRDQLRGKGYRAFVDQLVQGGQTVFRVRVGPEQQRASAETIREQLRRESKLKGIVLHIP